ncbi:MAG TPA: SDR family NAD(P)-dependent oxidoreductase [Spirochaetales bacterium]|nr:SDR family NAD(P)-dependent oxidoreductase [Spirochaetales bacterium]HPM73476.1 SDR family NAD(P)-dependent oxidoreductase [Spirochaetales bacterium]
MPDRRRLVVIVTGASSGLGNACATQLAKRGYAVYGTSRDPASRERKADEFFELIRLESSDDDSVSTAVGYVLAKEGRLDALVCCAGMGIAGPIEETPVVEAATQMDVNFMGVARVVRAALPSLRESGGRLVVVGSLAGSIAVPYQAYYAASKAALAAFVEALRLELVGLGAQATLVEPGDFRTGFTESRHTFGLADGSPYADNGRRAIAVMADSERHGADPVLFARLVTALFEKKRLAPRYRLGPRSQRAAMRLKDLLPRRIGEALLGAYFRIYAGKGA